MSQIENDSEINRTSFGIKKRTLEISNKQQSS